MTRVERSILIQLDHIRAELGEPLTARRTYDAMVTRILKRLAIIEAAATHATIHET